MATTICSGQTSYTNISATLSVTYDSLTRMSGSIRLNNVKWTVYTAGSSQVSGSNGARYLHICNSSGTRLCTATMTAASYIWNTQNTYTGTISQINVPVSSDSTTSLTIGCKVGTSSTALSTSGTLCWTGNAQVTGGSPSMQTKTLSFSAYSAPTVARSVAVSSTNTQFWVYNYCATDTTRVAVWTQDDQSDIKWINCSACNNTINGSTYNYYATVNLSDFPNASSKWYQFQCHSYPSSVNSGVSAITAGMRFYYMFNATTNGGTLVGDNNKQGGPYDSISSTNFPSATKSNATFNGWYNASSGGTKITGLNFPQSYNITGASANQGTLYAQFTSNNYTIYYRANGTTTTNTYTQTSSGGTFTTRAAGGFSKTGYYQSGWTTSTATTPTTGSYALSTTYNITADLVLRPCWTANTYYIYFYKGDYGTGTNTSGSYTYGYTYTTKGNIFTRTGYTQSGWSLSTAGTTYDYAASTAYNFGAATTYLYPYWVANTYTITYQPGSYGSPSQNYVQTKTYGTALTLYGALYSRTNYTQTGWSTSSTGSSKTYNLSASYTSNAAATLYPYWSTATSTINLYVDGSYYTAYTGNISTTCTLPTPTKSGYRFVGWYTSSSYSGTKYSSYTYPSTSGGSVNLYGYYVAVSYVNCYLGFNTDGSYNYYTQYSGDAGTTINLPTVSSGNTFTFYGWYSSGSYLQSATEYTKYTTITLPSTAGSAYSRYGIWSTHKDFYIDGSFYTYMNGRSGTSATCPSPSKTGYTFHGWYTNSSYTGTATTPGSSLTFTGTGWTTDATYYGYYTVNPTYIYLYVDGTYKTSYSGSPGGTLTLPTYTSQGHTFNGWYTSSACTGTKYSSYTYPSAGGTAYLYAKFDANTYKYGFYTYRNPGDTLVMPIAYSITYGSSLVFPSSGGGTKTGYSLDGWDYVRGNSSTDEGEMAYYKCGQSFTWNFTADTYFYPHFAANTYAIFYKPDSYSDVTTTYNDIVTYDSPVTIRDTYCTRTGYYQENWKASTTSSGTYVFNGGATIDKWTFAENITLSPSWQPNTYKITFNANGGTCNTTSINIKYGYSCSNSYITLPTPTRENFEFLNWRVNSVSGVIFNKYTTYNFTSDITLYAEWRAVDYTLAYNSGDYGKADDPAYTVSAQINTQVILRGETYYRTGYTQKGWSTKSDGSTKDYNLGGVYSSSSVTYQTIFPYWEPNTYTWTFAPDTGETLVGSPTKTVTFGQPIGTLPTVERTGFTFNRWFYIAKREHTEGDTTEITYQQITVTPDMVIVDAEDIEAWSEMTRNTYTLTYDAGIGTVSTASKDFLYEDPLTYPTPTAPTGYTFLYWGDDQGDEMESDSIMPANDLTVYAYYKANPCYLTLDTNGGDPLGNDPETGEPLSPHTVYYDDAFGDLPIPTRKGYAFIGWFTEKTGGTQINRTTVCKWEGNHTIYAQWSINSYTITYNPGEADNQETFTQEKVHGTPLTLLGEVYYKTRMFQSGWSDDYALEGEYTTDAAITLTPVFEDGEFLLTFNETDNEGKSVYYREAIGELPTPTKEHYSFLNWRLASNNEVITADTIWIWKYSTAANPEWKINRYTVFFNAGNGYTDVESITADAFTKLTSLENTPEPPEGYEFIGWCKDEDCNELITSDDELLNNITFYAKYNPLDYTITYNAGEGSCSVTSRVCKFDAVIYLPSDEITPPTGYLFDGWYDSEDNKITNDTVCKGNQIIYAKYTPANYKVSFNMNGSLNEPPADIEVAYNSAYGELPTATRTGYTLKGWFTSPSGGDEITTTTVYHIAGDSTLYAQWTADSCRIFLDVESAQYGDGAKCEAEYVDSYYDELYVLPIPTPGYGYEFNGWWTEPDGGSRILDTTKITGSTTVYARYIPTEFTLYYDVNSATNGEGATINTTSVKIPYLNNYILPEANEIGCKAGYEFDGWYDAAVDGRKVDDNWSITKDTTIYAHYKARKYIITYDNSTGDSIDKTTQEATYNELIGAMAIPVKDRYEFLGWYTQPNGKGTLVEEDDLYTWTDNITLYPSWTITSANLLPVLADEKWQLANIQIYQNGRFHSAKTYTFIGGEWVENLANPQDFK